MLLYVPVPKRQGTSLDTRVTQKITIFMLNKPVYALKTKCFAIMNLYYDNLITYYNFNNIYSGIIGWKGKKRPSIIRGSTHTCQNKTSENILLKYHLNAVYLINNHAFALENKVFYKH